MQWQAQGGDKADRRALRNISSSSMNAIIRSDDAPPPASRMEVLATKKDAEPSSRGGVDACCAGSATLNGCRRMLSLPPAGALPPFHRRTAASV